MHRLSEHRVRTRDGVAISLLRVEPAESRGAPPILLAPGTFSARDFWLGRERQGLGFHLAEAGYETWVLEPRGRGGSDRPRIWTMNDWIRLDAPAAIEATLEGAGADRLLWVGHSAGGVVGAAFAGSGEPLASHLSGIALLGSPGPVELRGGRWAGAWLAFLAGSITPSVRWSGRMLRLGPEHETGALIREWMWWNISGRWRSRAGHDYLGGLASVRVPVLGVAGTGDRILAPPAAVEDLVQRFGSGDRKVIVAGRTHGFSIDYDHAALVIGRPARREIWPRLIEWIERNTESDRLRHISVQVP